MQRDREILSWIHSTIHAFSYVELLAGDELNNYIDGYDVHYNLLKFQDALEERIARMEALHEEGNE